VVVIEVDGTVGVVDIARLAVGVSVVPPTGTTPKLPTADRNGALIWASAANSASPRSAAGQDPRWHGLLLQQPIKGTAPGMSAKVHV
jgi:hypothetical protein